jgi:hypothetical protein
MGFFDTGPDYGKAQQIYGESEQKILDYLKGSEATGRGDITGGLAKAETYGQPYMQAGTQSLDALMQSLGIGPKGPGSDLRTQFQQSPGYQYTVQQANNAARRQAAATGQGMSGAELRGITAGAQGEANKGWQDWYNNYQNRLGGIVGIGQATAGQQSGIAAQGGFNLANLGLGYGQLNTQEMQAAAKAKAEAELAKGRGGFWDILENVGSVAGGIMGLPTGSIGGSWLSSLFSPNKEKK